jgi:hypothetical protein
VHDLIHASYKEGGANCITPGPMNWRGMVCRLRDYVAAIIESALTDGSEAEREKHTSNAWALRARTVVESDDRILALLDGRLKEKKVEMTARELETELCRYAGTIANYSLLGPVDEDLQAQFIKAARATHGLPVPTPKTIDGELYLQYEAGQLKTTEIVAALRAFLARPEFNKIKTGAHGAIIGE